MTFEEWYNESNTAFMTHGQIAEAAWQAAQPQWQPIETAPKNGKRFLVYCDGGMIQIGFFMRKDDDVGLEFLFKDGDVMSFLKRGYSPIYWQPLPQPPNV